MRSTPGSSLDNFLACNHSPSELGFSSRYVASNIQHQPLIYALRTVVSRPGWIARGEQMGKELTVRTCSRNLRRLDWIFRWIIITQSTYSKVYINTSPLQPNPMGKKTSMDGIQGRLTHRFSLTPRDFPNSPWWLLAWATGCLKKVESIYPITIRFA